MIQSLDFSKWLERLGLKIQAQPPVLQSVQPVVIVGDHTHLVTKPLLTSYLVGSSIVSGAGMFPSITGTAPVPMRCKFVSFANSVATSNLMFALSAGPPGALANPTILVPQLMRPAGIPQARWIVGDQAVAPVNSLPAIRIGTSSGLASVSDIFVPAGGNLTMTNSQALSALVWVMLVDELPNENAQ